MNGARPTGAPGFLAIVARARMRSGSGDWAEAAAIPALGERLPGV